MREEKVFQMDCREWRIDWTMLNDDNSVALFSWVLCWSLYLTLTHIDHRSAAGFGSILCDLPTVHVEKNETMSARIETLVHMQSVLGLQKQEFSTMNCKQNFECNPTAHQSYREHWVNSPIMTVGNHYRLWNVEILGEQIHIFGTLIYLLSSHLN